VRPVIGQKCSESSVIDPLRGAPDRLRGPALGAALFGMLREGTPRRAGNGNEPYVGSHLVLCVWEQVFSVNIHQVFREFFLRWEFLPAHMALADLAVAALRLEFAHPRPFFGSIRYPLAANSKRTADCLDSVRDGEDDRAAVTA
jgi:hypothetical protein